MRRLLLLLAAVSVAACGAASSPVSPGPGGGASTDARGTSALVTLSGTVRGLDVTSRTFTLAPSSGPARLVRADETTEIRIGGALARFGALQNGTGVSVGGLDLGRYVQARTIAAR